MSLFEYFRFFDVDGVSDYYTDLDKNVLTMRSQFFQYMSNEIQKMASYKSHSETTDYKVWQENVVTTIAQFQQKIMKLKQMCPQNEIQDLFINLYNKRHKVAFYRIPIIDILYSDAPEKRGYLCDKTITWILKVSSFDL